MWILAAIQRPTELPVVNVVALVLVIASVIPVWLATRISSESALSRG
jgi:putative spermidine/putrescine transport system permease protein